MTIRDDGYMRHLTEPAPDAARAACYLTGSRGPCIDTGILVDFEGTLTISDAAIKQMAEVAGFSVNEDGLELEIRNAELEHNLASMTEERDQLLDDLTAIANALKTAAGTGD